ncbi:unnamed protein product, partial [marine sediment metagenome]
MLADTKQVNSTLGVEEEKTTESYEELRNALVKTVQSVHPSWSDVQTDLLKIANFMMNFDKVISLNYDLLVYWAMLIGNTREGGNRFKDCFVRDETTGKLIFDETAIEYMEMPHGSQRRATLIYYPHGNLVLANEPFGDEVKLSRSTNDCLLEKIVLRWELGGCTPLFVGEGRTRDKMRTIRNSHYLTNVYNRT